jgi:hypothetical protein
MRNERWFAVHLVLAGVVTVAGLAKVHYVTNLLAQMTANPYHERAVSETFEKIKSGRIQVVPATETRAVRAAVGLAKVQMNDSHEVYTEMADLTRRLTITAAIVFVFQLVAAVWWVLARKRSEGGEEPHRPI